TRRHSECGEHIIRTASGVAVYERTATCSFVDTQAGVVIIVRRTFCYPAFATASSMKAGNKAFDWRAHTNFPFSRARIPATCAENATRWLRLPVRQNSDSRRRPSRSQPCNRLISVSGWITLAVSAAFWSALFSRARFFFGGALMRHLQLLRPN